MGMKTKKAQVLNLRGAQQRVQLEMRKLEEAIHYICARATDSLGAVKLNKILYYSDMVHYATTGAAITGATYAKQAKGPVPKQVLPAIDNLVRAGRLAVQNVSYFDLVKREFTTYGETDLSVFSNEEIACLDHFIDHIGELSAKRISDISHTIIWKAADMGETLPYDSFFVSYIDGLTDEEMTAVQSSIQAVERESGRRYL